MYVIFYHSEIAKHIFFFCDQMLKYILVFDYLSILIVDGTSLNL